MKIITQVVILTLSLLLVKADQYCDNLVKDCRKNFQTKCTNKSITINNCCDLKMFFASSGVYKIRKTTFDTADAYCDMITDGGGWLVIQRNKKNTLVDFNKNWTDYERGFGDLNTEFWYGLELMHCLTQRGQWEMRVDYQRDNNTWSYLHYNQFSVGSASEEYPLTVGGFTGVGTDEFNFRLDRYSLNKMKFTTPDNDNDNYTSRNCATAYKSGWWHNFCYYININHQPPRVNDRIALFSEMKIRPKGCSYHTTIYS